MEGQASLDKSLELIRGQAALMRKSLDADGRLLIATKYASAMLSELRTQQYSPKQYYELYIACFDALSQLGSYLREDHKNHHLADIYEIVQYTGHVVPRLYLMITVGSAYMSVPNAPVKDILTDLLEMCRGVQHPLRGLFIRYYLGQRTREYLPSVENAPSGTGSLGDSIKFVITNFIEMNKLWVRYQHQGHSREWQKRLIERKELQIIVGSNLVRLAQLDGVTSTVFAERILPQILEQVVQCRDVLAQEYLLDVVVMAFPAEYHLETLDQYLAASERLTPQTALHKVLKLSIDRLIQHLEDSNLTERLSQMAVDQQDSASKEASETTDSKTDSKETVSKETDSKEVETDSKDTAQATDSKEVKETSETADTKEVEAETKEESKEVETKEETTEVETEIKEASELNGNVKDLQEIQAAWGQVYDTYWKFISQLKSRLSLQARATIAQSLIKLVLLIRPDDFEFVNDLLLFVIGEKEVKSESETPEPKPKEERNSPSFASPYKAEEEPEQETIVSLLSTLLDTLPVFTVLSYPNFHTLLKAQDSSMQQAIANHVLRVVLSQGATVTDMAAAKKIFELFGLVIKGGDTDKLDLAELVHLLRGSTAESNVQLLKLALQSFKQGGVKVIQRTYPSLVSAALTVLRQYPDSNRSELLKFINKAIYDLGAVGGLAETAFRLYVFAGSISDQLGAQEASYEFFVEAFTLYEEQISDSRAQYQALCVLISYLRLTTGFSSENYDTLASRCTLYGQKLLKKPDQCRAAYLSANLWWVPELESKRNDSKLLDALQRAFSVADAYMDTPVSIGLFVELLDRYVYFYDHGSKLVTAEHVNRLIEHINKELESNDEEAGIEAPKSHFERTLDYIRSQRDSEPRFSEIHT